MFISIVRKILTLLVIYTIILIGIFVLQFRNDSIISDKLGSLHITLYESKAETNSQTLRNKFSATFNGISFFASEDNPVKFITTTGEKNLLLKSWQKEGPLSCVFHFTNDINIRFILSDETVHAILNIQVLIPDKEDGSSVYFPYEISVGNTVNNKSDTKIQITNKNSSWELNACSIDEDTIVLTRKSPIASYTYFDKTRAFNFDMASSFDYSSETVYFGSIEKLKSALISSFTQGLNPSSVFTEQEVVSYISAMADSGRYSEAIDTVPQGFKKGSSRTYFSSPFFGNLSKMNDSLTRQMRNFETSIRNALDNSSYDIFSVSYLSDFISLNSKQDYVINLIEKISQDELNEVTVIQASGILNVYDELCYKAPELANMMDEVAKKCLSKIESSCSVDDKKVIVTERGTFLSVISAVQVGASVIKFGQIRNFPKYVDGGRLIINSYLKDCSSFDLTTLSEIYHYIQTNSCYPHFEFLYNEGSKKIWSWTCASNMGYEKDSDGSVSINEEFPVSLINYSIIRGIEPSNKAYIYDEPTRADARYENFNSSGYYYDNKTKAIFYKSRHKNETEVLKLVYTKQAEKTTEQIKEAVVKSDGSLVPVVREEKPTPTVEPVIEPPVQEEPSAPQENGKKKKKKK